MAISNEEKVISQNLIDSFIELKHHLPYANLNKECQYVGWVSDFRLINLNKEIISLNLKDEGDMFLLFVLAVVWSRTGPWENSAFFVAYLKVKGIGNAAYWADLNNSKKEENARLESVKLIICSVNGIRSRKKISFRKDIFDSINVLAQNWEDINGSLALSEQQRDYKIFMKFIRDIEGLGVGRKKILIKIPLILRELRCQNIYKDIPGELCCVPDARVYDTCKEIGIKLPITNSLENLILSSSKIYQLFGDLYDLPLFAYYDLKSASSESVLEEA